jgi:hypothetical protein
MKSWQKVREIFDSALHHKPDERRRFVNQACGDDKTLLAEVESLLSSHDGAESFMETPRFQHPGRTTYLRGIAYLRQNAGTDATPRRTTNKKPLFIGSIPIAASNKHSLTTKQKGQESLNDCSRPHTYLNDF